MSNGTDDEPTTPDAVYEAMTPLEPYTAGELADVLGFPKRVVARLLNRLENQERVRKKRPEPDRTIWIREPERHRCSNCDAEFAVKFVHPIFQAVQFCPECGHRVE